MMIYTIHDTDSDHLNQVISEMERLGSPTIRVVDCGDYYMAIEGCHRIAAAAILGVPVLLDVLEQEDEVEADSLDIDYFLAGETYTAGEIAGECYSPGCIAWKIDDAGIVTPAGA